MGGWGAWQVVPYEGGRSSAVRHAKEKAWQSVRIWIDKDILFWDRTRWIGCDRIADEYHSSCFAPWDTRMHTNARLFVSYPNEKIEPQSPLETGNVDVYKTLSSRTARNSEIALQWQSKSCTGQFEQRCACSSANMPVTHSCPWLAEMSLGDANVNRMIPPDSQHVS